MKLVTQGPPTPLEKRGLEYWPERLRSKGEFYEVYLLIAVRAGVHPRAPHAATWITGNKIGYRSLTALFRAGETWLIAEEAEIHRQQDRFARGVQKRPPCGVDLYIEWAWYDGKRDNYRELDLVYFGSTLFGSCTASWSTWPPS